MLEQEHYISATEHWVKRVIMKYNLCPFARQEVERASIRYAVVEEHQPKAVLQALLNECSMLDEQNEIATTLVILPRGFEGFYAYLDLVDLADEALFNQGYEGKYQLASFHPDYCFDGEPQDDAANYTNRSPYPTLHIIREDSMEKALASYAHPESIPERNIIFARRKGSEFFVKLLAECHEPHTK
ncbi:DUF1415 domain-containing protein [Oceanisphaera pacifica]|uniref:DUF1415 domain-containing protein n=1 Tax=Oceanisphaera pacifica TaxID=2818389 RepID=A0ABS3NH81_9GAMM|nr:DUF1415 domain-containing protein [Oceanisphaera pacifica]MBO1519586.1 DUF1415 domain-containing protein [Oceanisphaera pacifica]